MNPYSALKEHMEQAGKRYNPHEMARGSVVSTDPLVVRVSGTEIPAQYCYCNAALLLTLDPGSVNTEETALKQCLTAFYEAFRLSAGDQVLVQQSGNEIYVLCKAVAAA